MGRWVQCWGHFSQLHISIQKKPLNLPRKVNNTLCKHCHGVYLTRRQIFKYTISISKINRSYSLIDLIWKCTSHKLACLEETIKSGTLISWFMIICVLQKWNICTWSLFLFARKMDLLRFKTIAAAAANSLQHVSSIWSCGRKNLHFHSGISDSGKLYDWSSDNIGPNCTNTQLIWGTFNNNIFFLLLFNMFLISLEFMQQFLCFIFEWKCS